MKIIVTGANGKLGRVVERELRDHGHRVLAWDRVGAPRPDFTRIDLDDAGSVGDALHGVEERHGVVDGIVHLAAIPAPGHESDVATFRNNVVADHAILQGARRAGIRRIALASSETVLGLPFTTPPPYAPVDERYDTRPESTYSLGKHLTEEMARKIVRWDPELSISALRFSNVMTPADYPGFEEFQHDASLRRWNLWGYIDARDAAQAAERALETAHPGFDRYIIAAADTVMRRPSAELLAEQFPDVEVTRDLGEHETLLAIEHARDRLGYAPQHSWRDHV